MNTYDLVCPNGHAIAELCSSFVPIGGHVGRCPCGQFFVRRIVHVATNGTHPRTRFHSHLNNATGKFTTSMRQFRDDLKRGGEDMHDYLGMDTNYEPVDPADARAVFNITDEGVDAGIKRDIAVGRMEYTSRTFT